MFRRLVLASALFLAAEAQQTGSRSALLVGNSSYRSLKALTSPGVETRALEAALQDSGFQVTRKDNLGFSEYLDALTGFQNSLKPGDTAFFYFSGYTAHVDGDDNYMLPVEFDANGEGDMETRSLRLRLVQQRLAMTEGLRIVMLEAPHTLDLSIRGATDAGLQEPRLNESRETQWAFASSPGPVQAPGPDGVGLFTAQVVQNIRKHGTTLRSVFQEAKDSVAAMTKNAQVPLVVDNVTVKFYFHEPDPIKPPPPVTLPPGFPVTNPKDKEDYRWIPPGEFKMGCVPTDQGCKNAENPQHRVTIGKGFWMGRNEVQVSSYKRYLQAESATAKKKLSMPQAPGDYKGWSINDFPMVNVSWQDANAYCGWAGGRLPTEAEWEYAARASHDPETIYPFDSATLHDHANFAGKAGSKIFDRVATVHSFDASPWGLNDMAGNVWEWVSDFYAESYYKDLPDPAPDPTGPKTGKDHVMRGGSFDSLEEQLRTSFRAVGGKGNIVGFRCVLEDTPATNKLLGR